MQQEKGGKPMSTLLERLRLQMEDDLGKDYVDAQEYTYFCTGTVEYGFCYAVSKSNLNLLSGQNPWQAQTVDEIISICGAKNENETNEEALMLWYCLNERGIWKEWYLKKELLFLNPNYYWIHYPEGCGCLYQIGGENPELSYDFSTGNGDYRVNEGKWKNFGGTFHEFKEYVAKMYKKEEN